jgi:hypothetical protein
MTDRFEGDNVHAVFGRAKDALGLDTDAHDERGESSKREW